jgi:2-polyprenyl-6-methoxyphenol hydroxylase-like FAD-dependent oxidoreductase
MTSSGHDVVIVGAGPTGLLLALALADRGLSVRVLERRVARSSTSRSVGIHPPALALLSRWGLDRDLIARGCTIRKGLAQSAGRLLGAVDFTALPEPYRFVLSVPQPITEEALEEALRQRDAECVARGVEVEAIDAEGDIVRVRGRGAAGEAVEARGAWVVGCDGKRSRVREAGGIPFAGGPYPHGFAMADFDDPRGREEAWIFLDAGAFAESFPLPGNRRRWVLANREGETPATEDAFRGAVARSTGHDVRHPVDPVSVFKAERFEAERFRRDRVLLAGDAAHVVSPVGGQGMNVGWLNAFDLAEALVAVARGGRPREDLLEAWEQRARRRARSAARRAEQYMAFGFSRRRGVRAAILGCALRSPLHNRLARRFALCDLQPA